jgi:uncharacterized protein (TIGR03083 family)
MPRGTPAVATVSDEQLRDALRSEYLWLANLLERADVWSTPSLCAGWTVREVVAHLTMPTRARFLGVLVGVVRHRGDFNAYADRAAKRDALRPTDELVDALRSARLHAWTPPGGGLPGALVHAVVHSLDIARPLGVHHQRVPEIQRAVLDQLTAPRSLRFFGFDEGARSVTAADIDWSFGTGPPVVTDADTAIMHLTGRQLS